LPHDTFVVVVKQQDGDKKRICLGLKFLPSPPLKRLTSDLEIFRILHKNWKNLGN
jgi:hypothetical protein